MRAEIQLPPRRGEAGLRLDGVDVSNHVLGLRLTALGTRDLVLQLDLAVDEVRFAGEPRVEVSDAVHGLLVAAGWTPPADLHIKQGDVAAAAPAREERR